MYFYVVRITDLIQCNVVHLWHAKSCAPSLPGKQCKFLRKRFLFCFFSLLNLHSSLIFHLLLENAQGSSSASASHTVRQCFGLVTENPRANSSLGSYIKRLEPPSSCTAFRILSPWVIPTVVDAKRTEQGRMFKMKEFNTGILLEDFYTLVVMCEMWTAS